jgi:hypothetical protein
MKAFKTFAECPINQKPVGIPDAWPWQLQDCATEAQASYEGYGCTVLSDEDYNSYIATHQASYDTWLANYKKVPTIVSPRQIRCALELSGVSLSNIEAAIAGMTNNTQKILAKNAWEYSVEFQRNNPLLAALGPSLGFSSSQLDDLFILAATL